MSVALTLRPILDDDLSIYESPVSIAAGSSVVFTIDASDYGTVSAPAVTAKNITTGATVTSIILSGAASVLSNVITLPTITSLTDNNRYRVSIQFVASGSTFIRYLIIDCKGEL